MNAILIPGEFNYFASGYTLSSRSNTDPVFTALRCHLSFPLESLFLNIVPPYLYFEFSG